MHRSTFVTYTVQISFGYSCAFQSLLIPKPGGNRHGGSETSDHFSMLERTRDGSQATEAPHMAHVTILPFVQRLTPVYMNYYVTYSLTTGTTSVRAGWIRISDTNMLRIYEFSRLRENNRQAQSGRSRGEQNRTWPRTKSSYCTVIVTKELVGESRGWQAMKYAARAGRWDAVSIGFHFSYTGDWGGTVCYHTTRGPYRSISFMCAPPVRRGHITRDSLRSSSDVVLWSVFPNQLASWGLVNGSMCCGFRTATDCLEVSGSRPPRLQRAYATWVSLAAASR